MRLFQEQAVDTSVQEEPDSIDSTVLSLKYKLEKALEESKMEKNLKDNKTSTSLVPEFKVFEGTHRRSKKFERLYQSLLGRKREDINAINNFECIRLS